MKEEPFKDEAQQEYESEQDFSVQIPRSITPIGIFFGTPAKRAQQENSEHAQADEGAPVPFHRRRRQPIGTKKSRRIFCTLASLVFGLLWLVCNRPPLDLFATQFWIMIVLMVAVYIILMNFMKGTVDVGNQKNEDGGGPAQRQ